MHDRAQVSPQPVALVLLVMLTIFAWVFLTVWETVNSIPQGQLQTAVENHQRVPTQEPAMLEVYVIVAGMAIVIYGTGRFWAYVQTEVLN